VYDVSVVDANCPGIFGIVVVAVVVVVVIVAHDC
jgi:hypothetical protein